MECELFRRIVKICKAIAREHQFEEVKKFGTQLEKRMDGIVYVGHYGYGSCPIEGANNKIKVLKRVAYGFRDFWYFRLRIMAALPGKRNSPMPALCAAPATRTKVYVCVAFTQKPKEPGNSDRQTVI